MVDNRYTGETEAAREARMRREEWREHFFPPSAEEVKKRQERLVEAKEWQERAAEAAKERWEAWQEQKKARLKKEQVQRRLRQEDALFRGMGRVILVLIIIGVFVAVIVQLVTSFTLVQLASLVVVGWGIWFLAALVLAIVVGVAFR